MLGIMMSHNVHNGQPRRPTEEWNTWRRALKQVFCTTFDRKLQIPLGQWITTEINCNWWITNNKVEENILYQRTTNAQWITYKSWGRKTRLAKYKKEEGAVYDTKPHNLVPTTITPQETCMVADEGCGFSFTSTVDTTTLTQTPWCQYKRYSNGSILDIVNSILNGTCIAVSDGSFLDGKKMELHHG